MRRGRAADLPCVVRHLRGGSSAWHGVAVPDAVEWRRPKAPLSNREKAPMTPTYEYLASPYSDPDPAVRQQRFEAACGFTAHLLSCRVHVFSPIVHCHPLALRHNLPKDYAFWKAFNLAFLASATRLRVLKLPGWKESTGVRGEIRAAREMGKPVKYEEPQKLA